MTSKHVLLVSPSKLFKDSYIDAVYEYIDENDGPSWHPSILRERFYEFIQVLRQAESAPLAGMVPASHYWLVDETVGYLGEMDLRHFLNDSLRIRGGHIGYRIRPSQRQKGYGKLLCKLGIEKARQRGIGDILITCDEDNIGSRRVIEANGGVFVDHVDNGRAALTRRYWVFCDK